MQNIDLFSKIPFRIIAGNLFEEKICRTISNTLPMPSGGWASLRRSSSGAAPLNRRPAKRDEGLLKPGSRRAMRSGFDWRRRRTLHPIFKPDSHDGERTSVDGATERFRCQRASDAWLAGDRRASAVAKGRARRLSGAPGQ
ncbi:hypothetical protein E1A91_D08G208800v1 [Gossypium mustelinum]|uniref:Uncharacterized protein n=1 Tax=Gossypium mustelinum TaxID=34275 RepID=A0A5D2U0Z0_GOSMU|nr:hypothetical protein E1A91_D08G208800v1 [Gossypium mustelinum]TYI70263.1 hypothetical protein E1A91_D08G208800v1 [Gossypium mustelinum]